MSENKVKTEEAKVETVAEIVQEAAVEVEISAPTDEPVTMPAEVFISHKQVKRLAMTRGEYNNYRDWPHPDDENRDEDGYLVEYQDGGKPNHPNHVGYISWTPKPQFDAGYSAVGAVETKTFNNTNVNGAAKQVSDLKVFGNGDMFFLVSKTSSNKEQWMKSTKVCNLPTGCLVQVTTQQDKNVAEALQFVPAINFDKKTKQFKKLF